MATKKKPVVVKKQDNPAIRLREIQEEMLGLLEEAEGIIRRSGNRHAYDAAKAYWFAHIEMALTSEHGYMGSCDPNMEKTINALDTGEDDDDIYDRCSQCNEIMEDGECVNPDC